MIHETKSKTQENGSFVVRSTGAKSRSIDRGGEAAKTASASIGRIVYNDANYPDSATINSGEPSQPWYASPTPSTVNPYGEQGQSTADQIITNLGLYDSADSTTKFPQSTKQFNSTVYTVPYESPLNVNRIADENAANVRAAEAAQAKAQSALDNFRPTPQPLDATTKILLAVSGIALLWFLK